MVSRVKLDDCTFSSDKISSTSFRIEKPSLGFADQNDWFEIQVYADIITLLINKLIRIQKAEKAENLVVFQSLIEEGRFEDIVNIESKFNNLLHIKSSIFRAFIKSAQAFSDSIAISQYNYSASFAIIVYALENMANTVYASKSSKSKKMARFCRKNIYFDRFLKDEIRQLEFSGKSGNEKLLFKKLLLRSYMLRNNYVHDAEPVPVLSQVAHRLSMAFVSHDQKTLFPSYCWLRRISNLALNNFLDQQPKTGRNRIRHYVQPYMINRFKAKKTIQKGQQIDESLVYLQQLSDDFLRKENLK
jgi:hypothetical protein